MFDSVGWGEIIVLVVAGLFILGPERLPAAAEWLGGAIRQVKEYASGARDQLKGELGSEFDELRKPFDELRKPLEELRGLRNFNPKTAATRALFDEGPAVKPNGFSSLTGTATNGTPNLTKGAAAAAPSMTKNPATVEQHPATGPAPESLAKDERPPIDPDAT